MIATAFDESRLSINYTAKKEKVDKLSYELDWDFIKGMAERMALNKDKYPKYNWQKPLDIADLNDAITRHFIEIQNGNLSDEQEYGHIYALALNSMMLIYQLKHNT